MAKDSIGIINELLPKNINVRITGDVIQVVDSNISVRIVRNISWEQGDRFLLKTIAKHIIKESNKYGVRRKRLY